MAHHSEQPIRLRRSIAAIALLIIAGTVAADDDDRVQYDHNQARRLQREGAIVSLESVLERAQQIHPGELFEVELERHHHAAHYLYEIEILDEDGRVWELTFDARNGAFLEEKIEKD